MAESPKPKETKESPHKVDEEDLDYVTLAKLGGRKGKNKKNLNPAPPILLCIQIF